MSDSIDRELEALALAHARSEAEIIDQVSRERREARSLKLQVGAATGLALAAGSLLVGLGAGPLGAIAACGFIYGGLCAKLASDT